MKILIYVAAVMTFAGIVVLALASRSVRSGPPAAMIPPTENPGGMVWIPPGKFRMGTDDPPETGADEAPSHLVELDGFWMDATEVTNGQFKQFVEATGYVTTAERAPRREDFAGQVEDVLAIPEDKLVAGSICFNPKFDPAKLDKSNPLWTYHVWEYRPNANWRQPAGEGSSIEGKLDHPVVHVSWDDAQAYCQWIGRDLPTEAEWEYAARGGLPDASFPWGADRNPGGKWKNNIWQGEFPHRNENTDGFETTAPVRSFPPNAYGLFEMSGNVWEWCQDWYRPDYYAKSTRKNPRGPADSLDPDEPTIPKRVQRGGSFMCSDNYCIGYRVTARMKADVTSGMFHTGFRTVLRPKPASAQ